MMPNSCVCCGHVKRKGEKVSMFQVPSDKSRRQQWLVALNLTENDVNEQTLVCSRHFLHGDPSTTPVLNLGKSFTSPKKSNTDRNRRALKRDHLPSVYLLYHHHELHQQLLKLQVVTIQQVTKQCRLLLVNCSVIPA